MKRKLLFLVVMLMGSIVFAQTADEIRQKEMSIIKTHGPTVEVPQAEPGSTRAIGDDCTTPIVVTLPAALPYTDAGQTNCGRGNTYSSTCLGSYDSGEDIIYRIDVTADVTVDIFMDPNSTNYTGILIADGCPDVGTCLDYATKSYSGGPSTLSGIALTAAGSPYFIMIDTWASPDCIPDFDLTITAAAPPPPGDNCTDAVDLSAETSPYSSSTTSLNNDFSFCYMGSSNDFICFYDVDPEATIDIWMSSDNFDTRHSMRYGGNCPGDTEIDCVDDPDAGHITWTNTTGSTERVWYIVAGYSSNSGDFTLEWVYTEPPACPAPANQTESGITQTTVDLNWTETGDAQAWEIYVDGEFTQINLTTYVHPFTLSGLEAATSYDWYVLANCMDGGPRAPGDSSSWIGPHTFTTTCDTLTTFPWLEDFEGTFLPACWSKIVQSGNDITQSSTQNHSPGGEFSARFSSFSTSSDYNQYLFSRAMTIDEAHRFLSFWYKKHNNNDELLEWGVASTTDPNDFTWTSVDLTTDWQKRNIDLKPWVGQTVYIGFHYYGDYEYYVYLDDVKIGATPPIPLSNWAIVAGILMIGIFLVFRYRRKLA